MLVSPPRQVRRRSSPVCRCGSERGRPARDKGALRSTRRVTQPAPPDPAGSMQSGPGTSDSLGAMLDLLVQPLLRIVGPDLLLECSERRPVRSRCVQMLRDRRQLRLECGRIARETKGVGL